MASRAASNTIMKTKSEDIQCSLKSVGYKVVAQIATTLQGSIWRAYNSANKSVVIKVANKYLHKQGLAIVNGKPVKVKENILHEAGIMKYLMDTGDCPASIVRFIDFIETSTDYIVIMEDGGCSLFDFIQKAHQLIKDGTIAISHWQHVVKVIFNQTIGAIEYIHSKNVCHFDLSLENILINDPRIVENKNCIEFIVDSIQIKLCDFGLAEVYKDNNCKSNKYCGKSCYKSPEIVNKHKVFDAKKNDIWCAGVSLYMMLTNSAPFLIAHKSDKSYSFMMNGYYMKQLLKKWGTFKYVNDDIIDLIQCIWKRESERYTLSGIKSHNWLSS